MVFELDKQYFASRELLNGVCMQKRLEMQSGVETKKLKSGKILFREGTEPKSVYLLRKGKVKIFRVNSSGRKHIVDIYTGGEIFGYRAIISHGRRPVTAMALEDCVIDVIPAADFRGCLENCPELCAALLKSLSHEFSVWVNTVSAHVQYPVKSRMALGLLVLREKYKAKGKYMEINLSRDDLAGYVGTVKESAVRVLQEFKKEKLVVTHGRKILILKPEELRSIVRFH